MVLEENERLKMTRTKYIFTFFQSFQRQLHAQQFRWLSVWDFEWKFDGDSDSKGILFCLYISVERSVYKSFYPSIYPFLER